MSSNFVFDQPHYDALNAAREAVIRSLVESLRKDHTLQSAVDLGCGVGHFSGFLRDLGFNVLALDGRQANLDEARRRFPGIEFRLMDAEDPQVRNLGQFDLVLCMGLYYHLENPFAAFRNCFAITGRIAIVEGMCVPGSDPSLTVRDEGPMEDQGLHHVALYPTENGLIKLLYRSGFPFVYRFRKKPDHPNYENSSLSRQMRTMVVASITPLASGLLETAAEPATSLDPWTIHNSPAALALRGRGFAGRLWRFMGKPWPEKHEILSRRWTRLFPS